MRYIFVTIYFYKIYCFIEAPSRKIKSVIFNLFNFGLFLITLKKKSILVEPIDKINSYFYSHKHLLMLLRMLHTKSKIVELSLDGSGLNSTAFAPCNNQSKLYYSLLRLASNQLYSLKASIFTLSIHGHTNELYDTKVIDVDK